MPAARLATGQSAPSPWPSAAPSPVHVPPNMGCTSSTANMPESQSSTTENTENDTAVDNSRATSKENEIILSNTEELQQRQVVPKSEITNNEIKIVSEDNIKTTGDNSRMETKDDQENKTPKESDDTNATKSSPLRDKCVSLKAVVEKVLSENIDTSEQTTTNNLIEQQTVILDRQIEEIVTECNFSEGVEEELIEDEAKESSSPTQSEDSRATRWEALADIAAELPPSLAVDPITGQIYSLTK